MEAEESEKAGGYARVPITWTAGVLVTEFTAGTQ